MVESIPGVFVVGILGNSCSNIRCYTPLFDHRRCVSMHQEASRQIVPVSHAWEFLPDIGKAQLLRTTDCTTAVTQQRERSSRQ
jgi:hypothetical protein